jgi:hypothetical protein
MEDQRPKMAVEWVKRLESPTLRRLFWTGAQWRDCSPGLIHIRAKWTLSPQGWSERERERLRHDVFAVLHNRH